jgi:hypothetical protein
MEFTFYKIVLSTLPGGLYCELFIVRGSQEYYRYVRGSGVECREGVKTLAVGQREVQQYHVNPAMRQAV